MTTTSSPGMGKLENLLPKPSEHIPIGSTRWNFLQMVQCWRVVPGTKRQSCGAQKRGSCKEIQWNVIHQSPVFDIRHLANILPSRQTVIFKYGVRARGNALQSSRHMLQSTSHLRGRPMAHGFSQVALLPIPLYGSETHRPGSRSG